MQVVAGGQYAGPTPGPLAPYRLWHSIGYAMAWEWDQDENHHQVQGQAQLDICDCAQFGPNPPGSLGAGRASSDGQTDRQTDRRPLLYI